jgi:hypothetical protein
VLANGALLHKIVPSSESCYLPDIPTQNPPHT